MQNFAARAVAGSRSSGRSIPAGAGTGWVRDPARLRASRTRRHVLLLGTQTDAVGSPKSPPVVTIAQPHGPPSAPTTKAATRPTRPWRARPSRAGTDPSAAHRRTRGPPDRALSAHHPVLVSCSSMTKSINPATSWNVYVFLHTLQLAMRPISRNRAPLWVLVRHLSRRRPCASTRAPPAPAAAPPSTPIPPCPPAPRTAVRPRASRTRGAAGGWW